MIHLMGTSGRNCSQCLVWGLALQQREIKQTSLLPSQSKDIKEKKNRITSCI